jgi:hypothetical protein
MKPKIPRPESERTAADRLTHSLGFPVHRSTVRRLKSRGIDLTNPAAVRHALANQERSSAPSTQTNRQTPPAASSAPETANQPLTSAELDQRLADLERDLLASPDYQTGRSVRIKISGYRELVRIQRERGQLIDRSLVEAEGYQIGNIIRTHLMQLPAKLVTQLLGLEYGEAVERAEGYVHALLTEIHQAALGHAVPLPSDEEE